MSGSREAAKNDLALSIIVATHNRASFLQACLVSLCEQSVDPTQFEIAVVANACTDTTPAVVVTVAQRYPSVRFILIEEPIAGLSRARNRGIDATSAPLIAMIDDDATADSDWIKGIIERFSRLPDRVAAIGGEIDPVWQAARPAWLAPWMMGAMSAASNMGTEARLIQSHEGLFEGNCCYRRAALQSVGGFPVELGRAAGLLLSGEGDINTLLRHQGWQFFFDPKILIHHTIHADRLQPQWLKRRFFWQGVSGYAMQLYRRGKGIETTRELTIDLPQTDQDWQFLSDNEASALPHSLMQAESLGFALAASGIITVTP